MKYRSWVCSAPVWRESPPSEADPGGTVTRGVGLTVRRLGVVAPLHAGSLPSPPTPRAELDHASPVAFPAA